MVRIVHPVQTQVVTKQGECVVTIALDININISADGSLSVSAKAARTNEPEEEKVDWAVPDFGKGQKLKFGKEE